MSVFLLTYVYLCFKELKSRYQEDRVWNVYTAMSSRLLQASH